jgi:hypothetical protein
VPRSLKLFDERTYDTDNCFTSCSNSSSGNDSLESDSLRRERIGDEDLYSSKAEGDPDDPKKLLGLLSNNPLPGLDAAGVAVPP